jgi:hypothetical protein
LKLPVKVWSDWQYVMLSIREFHRLAPPTAKVVAHCVELSRSDIELTVLCRKQLNYLVIREKFGSHWHFYLTEH